MTEVKPLTAEDYYTNYKAQETMPTWKIVAAVALTIIVVVGLCLLLASPLAPIALPLAIGLKLLIGAEIGAAIAALGTVAIAAAKNGCENALLMDLCDAAAQQNLTQEKFNKRVKDRVGLYGRLPTVEEFNIPKGINTKSLPRSSTISLRKEDSNRFERDFERFQNSKQQFPS